MAKILKILVVDDEEIMCNLFTDILQDEGHQVTTVRNGREAEKKIKKESFDLAFVDVHMPVMDGIKTLRVLRKVTPEMNIIMMDSMPTYLLEDMKKEGAVTCIHKPFNIAEVRLAVNKILKQKDSL